MAKIEDHAPAVSRPETRKRHRWVLFVGFVCALVACANPINWKTYERYRDQGREAASRGDWGTAEKAYYRAAMNVQMGYLGPDAETESLYNLGRAKRMVGKFEESEDFLKRALAIDEKRSAPDAYFLTTATLAELAATYFQTNKYQEGIPVLLRLEPIALKYKQGYTEQGRRFIKQLYENYASVLAKLDKGQEAERFRKVADSF